jgi:dihydroorotase
MKIIDAVFATSEKIARAQMAIDPQTGLISDFGDLGVPQAQVEFFPDDCLAFAGMGDIHIHAREDISGQHLHKEDFLSASAAALNGGVTHVADMPNNPVPPIDEASYRAKLSLTDKAPISILLYAGIGPETAPLQKMVPYKVYMGPSIGELFFENDQQLENALKRYQGQHVSFHCEDPVELKRHQAGAHHHLRRPSQCEVMATATALRLIEKFKLKGKLCHYSAGEGLPLIREARTRGVSVQCEVTPQHLYFSQDQLQLKDKVLFQMNPPIREMSDRDAMLAAARVGDIDFLATDHAPHTAEEKARGTSGLTGLDSYGAFVTWLLQEKGFTPQRIALMCAENPGRFTNQFLKGFGEWSPRFKRYGSGFGFCAKGFMGNVTVLNLKRPMKLTTEHLKTKVKHNPFVGVTFPGSVEQVFLAGLKQR